MTISTVAHPDARDLPHLLQMPIADASPNTCMCTHAHPRYISHDEWEYILVVRRTEVDRRCSSSNPPASAPGTGLPSSHAGYRVNAQPGVFATGWIGEVVGKRLVESGCDQIRTRGCGRGNGVIGGKSEYQML
jgi:hypothetical protein